MTPPDHKLSQVCVCVCVCMRIKGEDKESAHLRSCSFSDTHTLHPLFLDEWIAHRMTSRPESSAHFLAEGLWETFRLLWGKLSTFTCAFIFSAC